MMLKRIFYICVLCSTLQLQLGCGMLIYPERQSNDRGSLDPTIVVLDGAGLFMGVIPGVAALAVDALTGTIYKPDYKPENGASEEQQAPKVTSAREERRTTYPKS